MPHDESFSCLEPSSSILSWISGELNSNEPSLPQDDHVFRAPHGLRFLKIVTEDILKMPLLIIRCYNLHHCCYITIRAIQGLSHRSKPRNMATQDLKESLTSYSPQGFLHASSHGLLSYCIEKVCIREAQLLKPWFFNIKTCIDCICTLHNNL